MPRYCTVLVWWRDIHIYSLFKEGMFVAMDEYRYSINKETDGLNLGKMRHSFHSFVNSIIYFRLAAFGGISFLMFKEGGLRVTTGCRSLTHPNRGFSTSGGKHCIAMDGELLHYRRRFRAC